MFDENTKKDENVEVVNDAVDTEKVEDVKTDEVVNEDVKEEVVNDVSDDDKDAVEDTETKEEASDDVADEDKKDDDNSEEATDKDSDDVETVNDDADKSEEEKVDEAVDEDKEEKKEEEAVDYEKLKADYEELKAEREEEKAVQKFLDNKAKQENELAQVSEAIAASLDKAFKDNGIDTTKSIEELRKEDPAKAAKAEAMINEAIKIQEGVAAKQKEAQDNELREIVFNKAGRLFDKYNLNVDEAKVVCETFFNILENVGLVNLDDDLVAKVELAVGRAKLLCPKVDKVVEDVKDIADEVADIVEDLIAPKPEMSEDEKRVLEEIAKADKEESDSDNTDTDDKVEVVEEEKKEPTINISEFTESATTGSKEMGDSVNEDNVLEKMAALPFKERTAFYKANFELIDRACRKRKG